MEKISVISGRTLVLPEENIDTDQIIAARFLTTTTREGLGDYCFYDWRFNLDGSVRAGNPLERVSPEYCIIVGGRNFGCGSSREHAPWALLDMGVRAVISSEIADIFRNNSIKNGLLPIVVSDEVHQELLAATHQPISISLTNRTITYGEGKQASFPLDGFSRYCLMEGIDQMSYLLRQEDHITRFEEKRG